MSTPIRAPIPATRSSARRTSCWRHRRAPLRPGRSTSSATPPVTVTCGAYLFHYPGLVVLHDAQVHQARAQALLGRWDAAATTTCGSSRPTIRPPRPTPAVWWPRGSAALCSAVAARPSPGAIGAAHGRAQRPPSPPSGRRAPGSGRPPCSHGRRRSAGCGRTGDPAAQVRARHGLGPQHLVIGTFGGLTPEKRLPQVFEAVAALASTHPDLHVLLVGTPALHYDVADDAAAHGIADRVHFTGYVAGCRAAGAPAGRRRLLLPALADQRRDLGVVAAGGRGWAPDDRSPTWRNPGRGTGDRSARLARHRRGSHRHRRADPRGGHRVCWRRWRNWRAIPTGGHASAGTPAPGTGTRMHTLDHMADGLPGGDRRGDAAAGAAAGATAAPPRLGRRATRGDCWRRSASRCRPAWRSE